MNFQDITVVVQGPVQAYDERSIDEGITHHCLKSVRQYLPGAHIILSTWHEQDLSGLDYDELVLNDDPGRNIRHYTKNNKPRILNNNRQIVSTINGLKSVKTPYAIKLRTDNYLTSSNFLALLEQYTERAEQDKVFDQKVVITNTFSRKLAKGLPVAYHLSDFFYFGLTRDLVKLWDISLLEDYNLQQQGLPNPHYPYFPIDCTQLFWHLGLKNFDYDTKLKHLHDLSDNKQLAQDKFIASNLVIASPEELGLGLCKKFLGKARVNRVTGVASFYQQEDLRWLINQYCQGRYHINKQNEMKRKLQRWLLIRPVGIETKLKLIKRLLAFNELHCSSKS
ncbi:WavE lipopolysaccharide synthesis family protein [Motilimonas pumila]|uniref:LPS biosynthesis protein WavE n=1 Tax=Motilimonas pumila TaxID=2303987 RepID=A0A418YHL7_9GAMM|nr:WavE lipopolysaccharide synthesis family protein [Motilimonas pumila]RJG49547.1 LPS biosynthesis protein WavE [Motilimonas pumila]